MVTGEYGFVPKYKRKVQFIPYYQNFIDNYTKKDIRKIRYSLTKFKDFCKNERITIHEISPLLCEQFMDYLKNDAGLTGSTPGDYWKQFKRVLKLAVKEGLILNSPAEDLIFKGSSRRNTQLLKDVLTVDELKELAKTKCGNPEVKRAFLFACFSGFGMAELRKLKWDRIQNGKIIIFREKSGEQIINDLPPTAIALLGKPGNADEFIFNLKSDVAIRKVLKNWVAKAEIGKNISFYCGRHTFAVQLMLNGANLKTVADCMGHADVKHTIKYLNYVSALKSEAISKLPEIDI